MKIGELSKATGVKVGTIRFYERKKLLRAAGRTPSGYRTYSRARRQFGKGHPAHSGFRGFTLKEIKELLDLHRTWLRVCPIPSLIETECATCRGHDRKKSCASSIIKFANCGECAATSLRC